MSQAEPVGMKKARKRPKRKRPTDHGRIKWLKNCMAGIRHDIWQLSCKVLELEEKLREPEQDYIPRAHERLVRVEEQLRRLGK